MELFVISKVFKYFKLGTNFDTFYVEPMFWISLFAAVITATIVGYIKTDKKEIKKTLKKIIKKSGKRRNIKISNKRRSIRKIPNH